MTVTHDQLRNAPVGTVALGVGILANLVAVIGVGAAGFMWVGRIDTRVEMTREDLRALQSREAALTARITATEALAAATNERLRAIEANVAEIKAMLREQARAKGDRP